MTPREIIRARRKELGMSQEELALAAGYKERSAISRIERGLLKVSPEKAMDIAHALGMNPTDFFEHKHLEENPKQAGMLAAKIIADEEFFKAAEKYYELPRDKQLIILSLINSL